MRRVAFTAVLALCLAARVEGQEPCDSLVTRAFNEFDATRKVELLIPALDPRACPPRGSWVTGVQLLAQTLIEAGRDSLAAVWLRWAIRLAPAMTVDTLVFTPSVAAAFASARGYLARNQVAGDSLAATTWVWPAPGGQERFGRLQLSAASAADSGPAVVEGRGPIARGESLTLEPGTYGIIVWSRGDSLRVTREVLPGVVTAIEIRAPALARVPEPEPVAAPSAVQPRRRVPWKWVGIGAVGVGALVAALAGGGEKAGTGGIIITIPP